MILYLPKYIAAGLYTVVSMYHPLRCRVARGMAKEGGMAETIMARLLFQRVQLIRKVLAFSPHAGNCS